MKAWRNALAYAAATCAIASGCAAQTPDAVVATETGKVQGAADGPAALARAAAGTQLAGRPSGHPVQP